MPDETHYRKLERMYGTAPTNDHFRPTAHIEEGRATIVIPVRRDFFHAAHAVHGAVYFKALDDSAFFAVNSLVEDVFVLTVDFQLHLLRPVTDGELRATARVVFRSRRLYVAESELMDADGNLVARGTGTFVPSRIALTPDVGYA